MFIRHLKLKRYLFVTVFLMLQIIYCEFNINVNQRFYSNVTAIGFFRFHDFEPRNTLKTDLNRLVKHKRKPRGFQFHADNRDFNIELEFIVPFIRIPIERSMTVTQTAFRSLFNLNFQSLLTTGVIVAIGGVFAIILKTVFEQILHISVHRKSLRYENLMMYNDEVYNKNNPDYILNINKFATIMESKLQENNINISDCIQRSLCSYAQQNFYNISNTRTEGLPQIINGVFSLDFVRNYLSGTAIKNAADTAKNGDNCYKVYSNCNWSFPSKAILKLVAEHFNYTNIT